MSRGLVIHAPPPANELQPPGVHELSHGGLHPLALLPPPPPEEGGLDIDKASLLKQDHHNLVRSDSDHLVRQEGLDDTVDDVLDPRSLDVIPVTTSQSPLVSPCLTCVRSNTGPQS